MSKAREIADLLDVGGDVVLGALDNLPEGAVPDWNTLLNKPTLDDVFISYTGRNLRDETNGKFNKRKEYNQSRRRGL